MHLFMAQGSEQLLEAPCCHDFYCFGGQRILSINGALDDGSDRTLDWWFLRDRAPAAIKITVDRLQSALS